MGVAVGGISWLPCLATDAVACSGRQGAPYAAFPPAGATEVPPPTSIKIVGLQTTAAEFELEANGQPVPLPARLLLGFGSTRTHMANFWLVPGVLSPSTSYVLRVREAAGVRELTRFTTAATYDKTPGTVSTLQRLRLWRVRYDVREIAAGGCIFDEYEGYLDLDHRPGTVPGTPPEEIIHVVSLAAKNGQSVGEFVSLGPPNFEKVPEGGAPSPAFADWKPVLAPDREYCATVTLYGRNDQATPLNRSEPLCAPVINIDARKQAPASDAAVDAGPGVSDAGDPSGGPGPRDGGVKPTSGGGGCAFAPPAGGGHWAAGLVALIGTAGSRLPFLRRRRRPQRV